jgi:hypothetical protein
MAKLGNLWYTVTGSVERHSGEVMAFALAYVERDHCRR